MRKLLVGCAVLAFVCGCGGSGDDAVVLPTPTGSGFLTGKWTGRLAMANGGSGTSISYSFYTQHWVLDHEGTTVAMTSYKTESDGSVVIYSTSQGRIEIQWNGELDLIFDDPNDNISYIHLIVSADHNTLTNHWMPNDKSGGQLTRVVE